MLIQDTVKMQIVSKVSTQAALAFNKTTQLPDDVAEQVAKALGFLQGFKGKGGGVLATDAGLAFVGVDAAAYHTQVEKQKKDAALARQIANLQAKRDALDNPPNVSEEASPEASTVVNEGGSEATEVTQAA